MFNKRIAFMQAIALVAPLAGHASEERQAGNASVAEAFIREIQADQKAYATARGAAFF
jgi:hypothetical protein